MNNNINLAEIYTDFFEPTKKKNYEDIDDSEVVEESDSIEIDKLYINDESKDLLNKIIDYMKKYNNKEIPNYISFSILLENNNFETLKNISNILNKVAKKNNYVEGTSVSEVSMYKLEKPDDLKDYYSKSSIVILKDLKALDSQDDTYKKKLAYELNELLINKVITIVSGTAEEIKTFSHDYELVYTRYFKFKLVGIEPDVNDVYEEIVNTVPNDILNDEMKVSLLDYISESYPKTTMDYPTYRNNLCNDILFNNKIPKLEETKSMDEIFKELNDLVGLDKVKNILHELASLVSLRNKTKDDLKISNVNLHMVFLGPPGTGKTTVARLVAGILYNLKCIKQDKLIEVSSKDLVAEYVGQTAPKTMSVIEKAMGGVLFIDEAYSLASNGQNSYNDEAIATLIKAMEDYRDNLVVIFAGYTKEMQAFLESNSGIVSRIGYMLEFENYTTDELCEIFKKMVLKAGFILQEGSLDALRDIIEKHKNDENFGNARFVRNVYEKTIIKHASNTKDKKRKSILKTITKEDITE